MDDGDDKFLRTGKSGKTLEYINLEAGETGGDPSATSYCVFRRTGHPNTFTQYRRFNIHWQQQRYKLDPNDIQMEKLTFMPKTVLVSHTRGYKFYC